MLSVPSPCTSPSAIPEKTRTIYMIFYSYVFTVHYCLFCQYIVFFLYVKISQIILLENCTLANRSDFTLFWCGFDHDWQQEIDHGGP